MAHKKDGLPFKNGGSFHGYVTNNQRDPEGTYIYHRSLDCWESLKTPETPVILAGAFQGQLWGDRAKQRTAPWRPKFQRCSLNSWGSNRWLESPHDLNPNISD